MFSGVVVHGDGVGKDFGYPTANIEIEKINLADGVYAAFVWLNKKKYQAILVIMSRVDKVEVHLFNYKGEDFYGEEIEVEQLEKVSEIVSLDSFDELKKKILADVQKVKLFISSLPSVDQH